MTKTDFMKLLRSVPPVELIITSSNPPFAKLRMLATDNDEFIPLKLRSKLISAKESEFVHVFDVEKNEWWVLLFSSIEVKGNCSGIS